MISTGAGAIWYIWGVTAELAAGETLTLTRHGAYFNPIFSNFSGSIEPNDHLYAHVDSANHLQPDVGAVREIHEIMGRAYNNIAYRDSGGQAVRLSGRKGVRTAAFSPR